MMAFNGVRNSWLILARNSTSRGWRARPSPCGAQVALLAPPLGHVAQNDGEGQLVVGGELKNRSLRRELAAVLAQADHLGVAAPVELRRPRQSGTGAVLVLTLGDTRAQALRHQDLDRTPDHLRRGIAEDMLGAAVEELDAAVAVGGDDRFRRDVQDRGQALFRDLQGRAAPSRRGAATSLPRCGSPIRRPPAARRTAIRPAAGCAPPRCARARRGPARLRRRSRTATASAAPARARPPRSRRAGAGPRVAAAAGAPKRPSSTKRSRPAS